MFAALGRAGIAAGIVAAFVLGLAGTVYLSLRTSEVTVPDVVGQHFLQGQTALEGADLNIRKRAKRLKPDAAPDTILDQSPRPGDVVKAGQTVAVVVADENSGKEMKAADSGAPEEGEKPAGEPGKEKAEATPRGQNQNANASNRNANRNANKNANRANANNKNTNNSNANNSNVNGSNANRNNTNAGANTNGARNAHNANVGNRNANARNANANRPNTNARPPANSGGATNANRNANRRPTP